MRSYQHDVAWALAHANGVEMMKVEVPWANAHATIGNFSPAARLR
jgi:hypothetical protein